MAVAYLGKKRGKAYAKSLKGSKVAVVSFKPAHTVSWDYSQESP
jgi:hypothetical protein